MKAQITQREGQGRLRTLTWSQRVLWCLGLLAALAVWARGTGGVPALRASEASVRAAEVSAEPMPLRNYYGRRLEPREPVVLHGSGPVSEASFWSYSAALSFRPPMLTCSYLDFHDDLGAFFARLREDLERGPAGAHALLIPEIGLSLNGGQRDGTARVGAGREDARLSQLVAGLRTLNRPVFLRVGYAFNNPDNSSVSGYDPLAYVAAFRRIAATIRAADLQQVALVWDWSPDAELEAEEGGAREQDAEDRWLAFYPGDDVVDWWGLSLFSEPGITGDVTARFLAAADRHRFPVMIGEATPKGHETSEGSLLVDGWYRPYFGLVQRSRGVKAVSYLDRNWGAYPQWTTWGDARVEADPTVLHYTQTEIRRPLYAGLRGRASTESLLQTQ